ncbi:VOC family protein [Streptomyces sp. NPDC058374]|uniref:VOC family protein n=1 Tax=unclassified Streptomyces TaxID=2593676 RepID=UPI00364A9185
MPIATLDVVVLDTPTPMALANFYAAILGGTVEENGEGWVELHGSGVKIAFQEAPDLVPPTWPSPDNSQQLHLDLNVPDLDAAEGQILALGARPLDTRADRPFRVYADPTGHPFCLCKE